MASVATKSNRCLSLRNATVPDGLPDPRYHPTPLPQNTTLFPNLAEDFERPIELRLSVGRRHDGAHARPPFRHRREADARGEHTLRKQFARQLVRRGCLAHDHRGDGRLADAGVESRVRQPLFEIARVVPQRVDTFGLLFQYVERRQTRRRHGRRVRGRKQERTRAVVEKLDQVAAAAHVPAEHAYGFRKRAHLHVHAAVQVEMVDGSAPVAPQRQFGVECFFFFFFFFFFLSSSSLGSGLAHRWVFPPQSGRCTTFRLTDALRPCAKGRTRLHQRQ